MLNIYNYILEDCKGKLSLQCLHHFPSKSHTRLRTICSNNIPVTNDLLIDKFGSAFL
jgi:hypothetical protein